MNELPKDSTIVFEGFTLGDEDFMFEAGPWINVTKAYRVLKSSGHKPIVAHIPRAHLTELWSKIDINPARLESIRKNPERLMDPGLLVEVEPGLNNMMDGHHRLRVIVDDLLHPEVDPIPMACYLLPHSLLSLVSITAYEVRPNGFRVPLDRAAMMKENWGKYTNGERRT